MPTIAQRDLRNRSGEILRETERGATYVITVGGRPVAELRPLARRRWVSRAEIAHALGKLPPDPDLRRDVDETGLDSVDLRRDPWKRSKK